VRGWGEPDVKLQVAFADERVFRFRGVGKKHPTKDSEGRHSILGAGPLEFRCTEPFKSWTASFQGTTVATSTPALIAGNYDGPEVDTEMRLEATMAVPPWSMGSLLTEGESAEAFAAAIDFISGEGSAEGGFRYEQLFRATGTVRVGDESHEFEGSGLRIHRQGIRKLQDFPGHCWQSALFPSGKAFGYIVQPPRSDEVPEFNEGYLFTGDGKLVPGRVFNPPWLRKLQPRGEDVSFVFESELGRTTIEGETVVAAFEVASTDKVRPSLPNFPVLFQGGARYRWDGEETYGMIERSTRRDLVERP
jgi:hypothetical protein